MLSIAIPGGLLYHCVGRSKEFSAYYVSYPLGDILVIARGYVISLMISNEVNQLQKTPVKANIDRMLEQL